MIRLLLCFICISVSTALTAFCNPKHANCTSLLLIHTSSAPSTSIDIRITSPEASDYMTVFDNIPSPTITGTYVPVIQTFDVITTSGSTSLSGGDSYDSIAEDIVIVTSNMAGRSLVIESTSVICEATERAMVYISASPITYYVHLPPLCIIVPGGSTTMSYCVDQSSHPVIYADAYCTSQAMPTPSLTSSSSTAYCAITDNATCVTTDIIDPSQGSSSSDEVDSLAVTISTTTVAALIVLYVAARVKTKSVLVGDVVIYKLPKSLRTRGSKRDYGYGLVVAVNSSGAVSTTGPSTSGTRLAIQPMLRVMRCAPPTSAPVMSPLKTTHSWVSTRHITTTLPANIAASTPVKDSKSSDAASPTKDNAPPVNPTKGLELAPDKKLPLLFLTLRDIWGLSSRIISPAKVSALDSMSPQENEEAIEEESRDNEEEEEEQPLLLTYLEDTQSLRNRYRRASAYTASRVLEAPRFRCCGTKTKVADEPIMLPDIMTNNSAIITYRIHKPAYLKRVHLNTFYYNPVSHDEPETESLPTPPPASQPPEPIPSSNATVKDTISGLPLTSQLNLKSSPRKMTLMRSVTTSAPASTNPTLLSSSRRTLARGNSISSSRSYSISPRRLPSISLPTARNNSVAPDPIVPPDPSSMSPEGPTPMARAFSRLYSMPRDASFQDTPDPLTPSLYKKKETGVKVTEIE